VDADELERWKYVVIFLLANMLACMAVTTILNVVDKRRVRRLTCFCFKVIFNF
jgi:hypothetical protein